MCLKRGSAAPVCVAIPVLASGVAVEAAAIPPGLYGYDPNTDDIIAINTSSGVGTFHSAGTDGSTTARSLSHIPSGDLFYGMDASNADALLSFDGSGNATTIGPTGVDGVFHSLAYDVGAGTFYTVDRAATSQLYTVNPATGAAVAVGAPGAFAGLSPGGLAFDDATGTLYMISQNTDSLYTVDTATGLATVVGGFGVGDVDVEGLAFDASTGTLYMSTDSSVLYELSTADGTATEIGSLGFGIEGMTYVVPAPASAALAGIVACTAARRRRD